MNLQEYKKGDKIYPEWSLTERQMTYPIKIATLIDFTETYGIGTSATIDYHIEQLKENNYVVEEDNMLLPTHLGEALIAGHKKVGNKLLDFAMRDTFEKDLDAVGTGEKQMRDVSEKWLEIIVTNFIEVATRLNDFTKGFEYFYGQSRYVMKCVCGKADMALWQLPSGKQFLVSCPRYKKDPLVPNRCKGNGYFIPPNVQEAMVTDVKCTNCKSRAEVFLIKVTKGGQASLYCVKCKANVNVGNLADLKVNDGKCRRCSDTFPDGWHQTWQI
ncbi:hypothetical protein MKW92_008646 [Papaver armeniacum]|nr:hypothetical protein MKW92_008646 [Papaver armeniacum]